jgi:hypothetical protein
VVPPTNARIRVTSVGPPRSASVLRSASTSCQLRVTSFASKFRLVDRHPLYVPARAAPHVRASHYGLRLAHGATTTQRFLARFATGSVSLGRYDLDPRLHVDGLGLHMDGLGPLAAANGAAGVIGATAGLASGKGNARRGERDSEWGQRTT